VQVQAVGAVLVEDRSDQAGVEPEVRALDAPLLGDPDQVVLEVRAAQLDLGRGQEPRDLVVQTGLERQDRIVIGSEMEAVGLARLAGEADRDDLLAVVPRMQAHALGVHRHVDREHS
jgi:hypothetical protein